MQDYNFGLIYNQQTPLVSDLIDTNNIRKDLIDQFLLYAQSLPNCAGLASNQVQYSSIALPLDVVVRKRLEMRFFAISAVGKWFIIINPEITEYTGESKIQYEGCKTWINRTIYANRYEKIKVKYFDYTLNDIVEDELKGFTAQVFQHEINHLNGIEEKFWSRLLWDTEKHGRNELCICGSGKKYKQCCLNPILTNI